MATYSLRGCSFCGNTFQPKTSRNKWCSDECRLMDFAAPFNGVDGCWDWPLAIANTGYGNFIARESGIVGAHRMAYHVFRGTLTEGLCVCHACDNRKCFNPAHLFQGSRADNLLDMRLKGRQQDYSVRRRGSDHWMTKPENRDKMLAIVETMLTVRGTPRALRDAGTT